MPISHVSFLNFETKRNTGQNTEYTLGLIFRRRYKTVQTYSIKCWGAPEEGVLDVLGVDERVGVSGLIREEEDNEHEYGVCDDLLEQSFHRHLFHS